MAKILTQSETNVYVGCDAMYIDSDDAIYTVVFFTDNNPANRIVFSGSPIKFVRPSQVVDYYMTSVEAGLADDDFMKDAREYMDNWMMYDSQYVLEKYEELLVESLGELKHVRTLVRNCGNDLMARHYTKLINAINDKYRELLFNTQDETEDDTED